MLPYEDEHSLALLYHANSEPWLNLPAYTSYPGQMAFKTVGPEEVGIALPEPGDSPLLRLIGARRSCREFTGAPVALADLAALLHAGYGVLGLRRWPDGLRTYQRAVPSAGGLYPLEVYVAAYAVEGLAPDVYHFDARRRRLEPLGRGARPVEQLPALMDQTFLENAGAVVFLTAVFRRTMRKYGPRGYRYVLFEAGHAAQNICLRAIELGVGCVCLGGYRDSALNRTLGLDGVGEAVVYGVAVGHEEPPPAPRA